MMRFLLSFILVLGLLSEIQAQEAKGFDSRRMYFGGGINLSFGSNTTVVGATPIAGYHFTDRFTAGLGATYMYYRYDYGVDVYENSFYGGNVFGMYNVTESIFAASEFHVLNTEIPVYDPVQDRVSYSRQNVPIWFLGGGYRSRIGQNSFVYLTALWDVIEDTWSPYSNPYIRIGFAIGL